MSYHTRRNYIRLLIILAVTMVYRRSKALVVVELEDNRLPVAWYTMNGLDGTVARDYTFLHDGVASEVSEDAERYIAGGASYRFDGNGSIEVPDSQLLRMQSMKFTADVLVEGAGVQRIIEKGSNYALWVERPAPDMLTAVFEVKTADGVYQGSVTAPVAANKFAHVVAAHRAGEIYVEIDGTYSVTPAQGVINYGPEPVVIGRGLTGNLDNVKVWDLSFAAMSSFSNGSERIEVTLDENGAATVPLYSTFAMGSTIAKMQKARMQKGMIQAQEEYDGFVWDALITIKTYHKDNFNNPSTGFLGMVSSRTGILVSEFALGALYAEGEGGAAIAGDMVASLLYLGDARDAAFTGMKYYFGTAELADHVMMGLTGIALVPGADVLTVPAKRVVKAAKATGKRLIKRMAKLVGDMGALIKKGKLGEFYQKVNSYKDLFEKFLSDPKYMEMVEKTDPANFCTLADGAAGAMKPMGKSAGGIFAASTAKNKCDEAGDDFLEKHARILKQGSVWVDARAQIYRRFNITDDLTPAQAKMLSKLALAMDYALSKGIVLTPKTIEGMAVVIHNLESVDVDSFKRVNNCVDAAMNYFGGVGKPERFHQAMQWMVDLADLSKVKDIDQAQIVTFTRNLTGKDWSLNFLSYARVLEVLFTKSITVKGETKLISEFITKLDTLYNDLPEVLSKRTADILGDGFLVEVKNIMGKNANVQKHLFDQAEEYFNYIAKMRINHDRAIEIHYFFMIESILDANVIGEEKELLTKLWELAVKHEITDLVHINVGSAISHKPWR